MIIVNNSSFVDDKEGYHDAFNIGQPFPKTVRIILAILLILAFVIGTAGNIIVLVLFIKYKSLRKISNIFVVNLTGADLLICVVSLPVLINVYLRDRVEFAAEFFCHLDVFLGAFSGFLSIWSLVCLTADRCIVISRYLPERHPSDRKVAITALVCTWLLALIGASLPYIGFGDYVFKGSSVSCSKEDQFSRTVPNIVYNLMIQVVFFYIPIVCVASCYIVIYRKVKTHEEMYFNARTDGTLSGPSLRRTRRKKSLERKDWKTAKAGFILTIVFIFSWAPYSIVYMIGLFGDIKKLSPLAVTLPGLFAKVSTVLNPLLYALLLKSFKSKLRLCCKRHFSPDPSSSTSIEYASFSKAHRSKSTHVSRGGNISVTII